MSSPSRSEHALLACVLTLLAATGCERERREFKLPAAVQNAPTQVAVSPMPGGAVDAEFRAQQQRVFGENAWQMSQGKQLYGSFNCYGCHAWGGGDIGPPLMDEKWIYGGEIDQIYLSIAQGRANGMPAFAGRLHPEQIWQLAAYVRSMSGVASKAASPGRDDHLYTPSPQEAKSKPPATAPREE